MGAGANPEKVNSADGTFLALAASERARARSLLETLAEARIDVRGGADPDLLDRERLLKRTLGGKSERLMRLLAEGEEEGTSGLSPYLHFGHISVYQVFHELAEMEDWFFHRLSENTKGSKKGWWGMSAAAEAFLDELVTWREFGFNMCWQWSNYDRYVSLPQWARSTLEAHALDERPYRYAMKDFETANTHGGDFDYLLELIKTFENYRKGVLF